MIDYVWLIPFVMALAALINGLGCRKLGKVAAYISAGAMAATFILSALIFLEVKGIADKAHHGHGGEGHSAAAHASGAHGAHAGWEKMSPEAQAAVKTQYLFVRTNPDQPAPWDTEVRGGQGGYVLLWQWINIPSAFAPGKDLKVDLAFQVDQLTAIFLLFISFVGSLVFIYASAYMVEHHDGHDELDPGYARFFCYLALFAASMYTLILGANFVVMFIGWEGVGLCSYLLIGYYFDRQFNAKLSCADAGKKAFVVNRVGDFGLMLGMFLLFWGLGTVDFQQVIHLLTMEADSLPDGFGYSGAIITAATLLLFLGATGKSAQVPLFVWLPDAMAGPTPVSALIHAATMVTAGVYMLARLNVLYMLAPITLVTVAIIGLMTAFVAAYAGLTQRGIKKILAYSTVSQLGFMFLAMGVGAFAAGIFHVFTHAFFKACLFLAAGAVIHSLHHEEDVFKMGGLVKKMPMTHFAYLFATLAIAGIFPFAGFFSKDEILYMVYVASKGDALYKVLWGFGVLTAAFTAFYMGRSLILAFYGKTRMDHHDYDHVHEAPLPMSGVLVVLGVASLLVGFLNVPKGLIPLGDYNAWFHHFLMPITDRGALHIAWLNGFTGGEAPYGPILVGNVLSEGKLAFNYEGGSTEMVLAVFSVLVGAGGLALAWVIYGSGSLSTAERIGGTLRPFWSLSYSAWKWDDVYDLLFVKGALRLYEGMLWFDKKIIDGVFVLGAAAFCRKVGIEFRRLQNGQVQVYGLVMLLGVCLFLLYFALTLPGLLSNNSPVMPARKQAAVTAPATSAVAAALPTHEAKSH